MATTIINSVGTGKDYTTLAAWWAAVKVNDVVTLDRIYVAEVYGQLTSPLLMGGYAYSTSRSNYFHIRAASGQNFKGDFGSLTDQAGLACSLTSTANYIIQIQVSNTRIEDLYLKQTNSLTNDYVYGIQADSSYIVYIKGVGVTGINCTNTSADIYAYGILASSTGTKVINCFVDDIEGTSNTSSKTATAVGINSSSSTVVLNCTVSNIVSSGTSSNKTSHCYAAGIVKNCLGMLVTGTAGINGVFSNSGTGSDYNASDDASAPGSNSLTSITPSDEITSTTAGTANCTLQSTADCVDEGTDLESVYSFDDDIAGNTRGTIWDIGASEYIAAVITGIFFNGVRCSKINGVVVNSFNGT